MKYGKEQALAEVVAEDLPYSEIIRIWNEMIEHETPDGTDNVRYIWEMETFNDKMSGLSPLEIAAKIADSTNGFDAYDTWYSIGKKFGSLKSFSFTDDSNCPIDYEELAYWLTSENGHDTVQTYDLDWLLEPSLEALFLQNVLPMGEREGEEALETYKKEHGGLDLLAINWDSLINELLEGWKNENSSL